MIKAVRHTGIVVDDLDKMSNFYRALGFIDFSQAIEKGDFIDQVTGLKHANLEWVKLKAPDGYLLELLKYHSHPKDLMEISSCANDLGCSHVAYTVENIEITCQKIVDAGGSIGNIPATSLNGRVKVAYCYDPEGVIMEIVEEVK
jgi:predicted enzyme related to lactoylglutathione lyase